MRSPRFAHGCWSAAYLLASLSARGTAGSSSATANGCAICSASLKAQTNYDYNQAPDWLLPKSAEMLGRIQTALADYPTLHEGIGAGFFCFMTPEFALRNYEGSLALAREQGDTQSAEDIAWRMGFIRAGLVAMPDIRNFTCRNTHGDFTVCQLICGSDGVNAVIGWTSACVHPAVWELMRSYLYPDRQCAAGVIDIDSFCDYYGQYYGSDAANRHIFLHQARFFHRRHALVCRTLRRAARRAWEKILNAHGL